MQLSKTYLNIVGATLIQSSALMAADIEGTFVQRNENGILEMNAIFTSVIVSQVHWLIKRSYRITDRADGPYGYKTPEKLTHRRSNSFGETMEAVKTHQRTCSDGVSEKPDLCCNTWFIHPPFQGIHGTERLGGLMGILPRIPCAVETDYAGFVALLPREGERPPLISVVFRGSQSKSFQPFGGILGPSWLTNFCAAKAKFPEYISGSEDLAGACFHEGYLRKYLSARINILAHIEEMLQEIPEWDRMNARIIITGHSQGAGVALPAALDITHIIGKKYFGADFDNNVTPRFFVYALSGPNSTGDMETKELMHKIIGRDNIVRHNSLFDIVPYACPGKQFDSKFYNAIFGSLAGVETGYHPVGHLAIDDIQSLIIRGFKYSNKGLSDEDLHRTLAELSTGFTTAMQKRQLEESAMYHIRAFFMSIQECKHLLKGASAADSLYFFACINHYGSSTANICCSPRPRAGSNLSIISAKPLLTEVKPGHESSFEPRLPEADLNPCLWRGQRVRELVKNDIPFESFEQVFSPDLPEPQVITYGPGPRAIAYNSESRLVSSEDDASESSSEDRLLPGRIVLEENEFVSDYESGSEWGSESGSDFSSDLSSNSESSSEAA